AATASSSAVVIPARTRRSSASSVNAVTRPAPRSPSRSSDDSIDITCSLWNLEQHDVRLLLHLLDDDVAAVRGDVEVPDLEHRIKIRELPFGAGLEIDRPEVLVSQLAAQRDQRSSIGKEHHVPCAAR